MNLYGHSQSWLMVDCGATFQSPLEQRLDKDPHAKVYDVVAADPAFIEARRDQLCAIVLTHAHEDHIGAVTEIWPSLGCPIYATPFTAEVLRRKFYQKQRFENLPIIEVQTNQTLDIGPFTVTWLAITHSLPEPQALKITTAVGSVFHTADWKIDKQPVVGKPFDPSTFIAMQKQKILAMVCDSTNALKPGFSTSEKACEKGLGSIISRAKGRVVVSCFASNLARLITLVKIAKANGRYVALFGRSLENMVSVARRCGYWPDDLSITHSRHIGYLPPHEVLIIATGSQGEPRTGLNKLATNMHRDCELESGDTVIFSSIVIPGNEKPIEKLVNALRNREIEVYQSHACEEVIHATGHPNQGDLATMYDYVKPNIAIPTHGEAQHMQANANIAQKQGVPKQLLGSNGDLFVMAPQVQMKRKFVATSRIAISKDKDR
ncbi:ribonuclease J [Glaciecola sp. XM2]|uniref:ribonuclease J n=1 Tax=Glaciecola sp. XM2 TaxID=1914931 RepID=UPI001BDEDB5A|nr:ribonuclease J [Glaciecola sp. XM2]MBT1449418.1 ribonuclease J [Glaciecola sp. XM2]